MVIVREDEGRGGRGGGRSSEREGGSCDRGGGSADTTSSGRASGGRGGRGHGVAETGGRSGRGHGVAEGGAVEGASKQKKKKKPDFAVGAKVFVRFKETGNIEKAEVLSQPKRGSAWYILRLECSGDTANAARNEVYEEGQVPPQDKGKQKKKKKKVDPWQKSKAKERLRAMLLQNLTHEYTTAEIERIRLYSKDNFCSNFKSLLKKEIEVEKIVRRETELFERDKRNHPPASHDSNGNAFFDSHAAKGMLVEYFEGLFSDPPTQQAMTPGQLWGSNFAYQDFEKKAFANFFYRQKRRQKESVGWQKKRNDQGFEQHRLDQAEARGTTDGDGG
jgi:hypothetical protein